MAEVAGVTVPTAKGFGSQFLHWGVPILAGVGGFFMGDIWGAAAVLEPWIGPVIDAGNIPFENRLNYRAFAAAGIYGVAAAIIYVLVHRFLPSGGLVAVAGKTVSFYLGGTTARLIMAGLLPASISVGGNITLPAIVR